MKQIGLVYDLRTDYLAQGYLEADVAEFDSEGTIDALAQTIESLGYGVERIGSGRMLALALAAGKRWDLVFTIAEGLYGRCREAQVPALLELYDIPYTFSDPLVCAATLDKSIAKKLVAFEGLPTPRFAVIHRMEQLSRIDLDYPLFVKPLSEGTGKGVDDRSMIQSCGQLTQICEELLTKFSQPVLVEEYLPGREFTVGIVGTGSSARVIGTMEISLRLSSGQPAIYSYLNKEECETRIQYSPLREPALKQRVESVALRCYQVLQCRDGGRVDIRCDRQGRPSFIEVNPLAGLHPHHSDLPMIATQEGMRYAELIGAILQSAFERTRKGQPLHGTRADII